MDYTPREIETLEVQAPFLPNAIVTELCSGRKWADYRARKLQLLRARIARAWKRQEILSRRVRQCETRFVNGPGQLKAVVDEELVAFTRAKYGRQSFHDPDHLNFILKNHPELRAPTPKPRYLMVDGFKNCGPGNGARGEPATVVRSRAVFPAQETQLGPAHETPRAQLLLEDRK